MTRCSRFAALFLLLLTAPVLTVAQSSDSLKTEQFWSRFETEFSKFIDNVTGDFAPADTLTESADTMLYACDSPEYFDDSRTFDRLDWARNAPAWRNIPYRTPWIGESSRPNNFIMKYNRVQGLFFGLGSAKKYYWTYGKEFLPYASIGYGFAEHRWRGNLGLARQVPISSDGNQLLELSVEGHSLTDTKDDWRIDAAENTASSFFLHQDFQDYFGREGFSLQAAYLLRDDNLFAEARAAYLVDQYRSLDAGTDWSLFARERTFRDNPSIQDGRMRSLMVALGASAAGNSIHRPLRGWTAQASAEFAGKNILNGQFAFNQYVADFRKYQRLSRFDNLNFRLRIGTSTGNVPIQRSFELGGLGTLPGYDYKGLPGDSLGGNRMILLNTEYIVNGDFLGDLSFWPSWLFRHLNFILVADAGLVRRAAPGVGALGGFGGMTWDEFRTDAGVGLSDRSGSFRVAAVWPTSTPGPARLLLRISGPF